MQLLVGESADACTMPLSKECVACTYLQKFAGKPDQCKLAAEVDLRFPMHVNLTWSAAKLSVPDQRECGCCGYSEVLFVSYSGMIHR